MGNKLSFFPSPYPDEEFRSIVYRYHIRSRNVNLMTTKYELFNIKSLSNNHFPRNFNFLVKQIHDFEGLSLKDILNDHTFYPLYKPFINKEYNEQMLYDFKYGKSKLTAMAKPKYCNLLSSYMRYCPVCLSLDYEKYGETYVHRFHQLDYLDFCHKHFVQLISECPKCKRILTNHNFDDLLTIPYCVCGYNLSEEHNNVDINNSSIKFKKSIFNSIKVLMHESPKLTREVLFSKFYSFFSQKGYLTYSRFIKKDKLYKDFLNAIPNSHFELLGIPIDYVNSKEIQLKIFVSNVKVQNIHLYLLFMHFIAGDVKQFLRNNEPYSMVIPFGNGPWHCINHLCPNYRKNRILKLKRENPRGKYIRGIFECDECGQVYKREWQVGDSIMGSDPKVEELGFLTKLEIVKLYNNGWNIRDIADKCRCLS